MWCSSLCILLLAALSAIYGEETQCVSRDFGHGGTVCVCNSQHCDTTSRPEKQPQSQYLRYTSDKSGLRFKKESGQFKKTSFIGGSEIIVNTKDRYQTILGFGGAFTDSTGINIQSLPVQAQEKLLQSYFSADGLEYNIGRVPIGGTDFSTRSYSYDDNTSEDSRLQNFKLANEDLNYKIPLIKQALNLTQNNLNLFASAWTAPRWMKTNKAQNGLGFLRDDMYQPWANYYVKFLDTYKLYGIDFWGITTGNEPSLAYIPFNNINSVGWTPGAMSHWIANNLGPTLRGSNHSNIKIMILDDQRFFLPWFVDGILENAKTRAYVDGIAVHWYYDTVAPESLLTDTHNQFPDKFILGTEACTGSSPLDTHVELGSWDRGQQYANDIIEDLSNWVGGWTDWNMALNLQGGPTYISNFVDSPIIVNATAGEFYKQPMFYAIGHFSKFIPRGTVRVHSTTFDKEIPVLAVKRPDNGTVLVILNKRDYATSASIVDDLRGIIQITLSAKSITTIIYW